MLAEAAAADAAQDGAFGPDQRGDELPAPLRRKGERLARLAEGKRQLDCEAADARAAQDAKIEAWEQRRAAGKRGGRRPNPDPRTTTRNGKAPRRNTTDPDARVMKTKDHLVIGYNAQAVVTDDQIIVGADLTQEPVDATLLPTMLDTTINQATDAGLNPTPTNTTSTDSNRQHRQHRQHRHRQHRRAPRQRPRRQRPRRQRPRRQCRGRDGRGAGRCRICQ